MKVTLDIVRTWETPSYVVKLAVDQGKIVAVAIDKFFKTQVSIDSGDITMHGISPFPPVKYLHRALVHTYITLSARGGSFHLRVHQEGLGGMEPPPEKFIFCMVQDTQFRVSQKILCQSDYFKSLLTGGMRESGSEEIEIQGVSSKTFKTLLEYLKYRKLPDSLFSEELVEFAYAVDQFGIRGLKDFCEKALVQNAKEVSKRVLLPWNTPYNQTENCRTSQENEIKVLAIWELAETLGFKSLAENCQSLHGPHDRGGSVGRADGDMFGATVRKSRVPDTYLMASSYYFSFRAVWHAVANGWYRILPKLPIVMHSKEDYRNVGHRFPRAFPAIEGCFSFFNATGEPDIKSNCNLEKVPVNIAIKQGYSCAIKWLSEQPIAQQLFTSEHVMLAAQSQHVSIIKYIINAMLFHSTIGAAKEFPKAILIAFECYYITDEKQEADALAEKISWESPEPPDIFFKAASDGKVEWMQLLAKHFKFNVDTLNSSGQAPLHLAAKNNRVQAIQWLLTAGATVRIRNQEGMTPYHVALAARQRDAALFLLRNGDSLRLDFLSKPSIKDQVLQGLNVLLVDAYYNHRCKGIEELLKDGAYFFGSLIPPKLFYSLAEEGDTVFTKKVLEIVQFNVDALSLNQETALHLAVKNERLRMIALLVDQKASLNVCGALTTPLHLAATNLIILKLLVTDDASNLNTPDANGNTALHLAAAAEKLEACCFLISHGASINPKPNKRGEFPLDIPAKRGHKKFVEEVVQWIAKAPTQLPKNQALLWIGMRLGSDAKGAYYDLIRLLIENGADPNTSNESQETALHYAAIHGLLGACEYLLKYKASVHVTDVQKQTPLHKAAERGHLNVVRRLVEAGAAVESWDASGYTPYQLAHIGMEKTENQKNKSGYRQIIEHLEKQSCDIQ